MRIPRAQADSLYARLGGYYCLVRVLDGISGRLMRDERMRLFFHGHNDTSKERLKQRFIDFICEQAGGPVHYTGDDLKTAHQGLGITGADFKVLEEIFRDAAAKHKLTTEETTALLKFIGGFKRDIVQGK